MRRGQRAERRAGWVLVGLSLGVGAGGCIRFEPFRCRGDLDCVVDGQAGRCRLAEQTCIYPDPTCKTQWSTADGACKPPIAQDGGTTGSEASDSGGSSGGSTTAVPGDCMGGAAGDITALGTVWASSVFGDQYPAPLSVDGDYGTSWLSAGVDLEGNPSFYRWTADEPRCIARIAVIGNGLHDNPEFREDYGYQSMIMRIYDADDAVVFQRMFILAGTPDPDAIAEPGVEGVRVELELVDHESFFCGGFSELEIEGS